MAVRRPFHRAPELPAPRPYGWEMKPLESATTGMRHLDDGRLELTIEHDLIRGVTPTMLHWWFTHVEAEMEHEGRILPRYLVWHPLDHIGYEVSKRAPDGSAGRGARFHIQEAFGRNPDYLVDVVDRVDKLDETGLVLAQRAPGLGLVFRLEHRFAAVEGGTDYRSQMLVGSTSPLGRTIFNRVRPRVFPDDMARAWLRHNVEEVGNFEHFLPRLYAEAGPR
jgi:hypothetical protein